MNNLDSRSNIEDIIRTLVRNLTLGDFIKYLQRDNDDLTFPDF